MYALIRSLGLRHLVLQQAPAIVVSIMIAELFYKFHSFTLECLAFLATWTIVDMLFQFGKQLVLPSSSNSPKQP